MAHRFQKVFAVATVAAFAIVGTRSEAAEEPYSGKTVTLVIGAGPGGSFHLYGQLLASRLGRHIPGTPRVIIQNMPGGGGRTAASYMQSVAPKDGTVICLTIDTVPIEQLLQTGGVRYDASQWNWIGNMASLQNVIGVWHTAPVKTIDDARETEVILGATGGGGPLHTFPLAMNRLLDTKFRTVKGYTSVGEIDKAIEGGEVQGRGGSFITFTVQRSHWVRDGKINFLVQMGQRKSAELPANVPLWTELTGSPEDKAVFNFLGSSLTIARSVFLPPRVPGKQVEIMRAAFDAAMKDPALLADAKKRQLPIDPMTGDEVKAVVDEIVSTPPALVERIRNLVSD